MTPNQTINTIESLESFCLRVSQNFASEGFDVKIHPGDHLVDDAGADSLAVLAYVSHLQEMGLKIDLGEFDTKLLNIDFAYQTQLQNLATQYQGEH